MEREQTWDRDEATIDPAAYLASLGPPLAEYRVGGQGTALQVLAIPGLFFVGLALLALPIAALFWNVRLGPALFKIVAGGCVLLGMSVLFLIRLYRSWGLRVLVYPEGLVRIDGERITTLFWDEVVTIWDRPAQGHLKHVTQGSRTLTLKRASGEECQFDDTLPNLKELGKLIQRHTLEHLLPAAVEELEAGGTIDFVKVQVTREGLRQKTDLLPWAEVKDLRIDENNLTIRRGGNWFNWLVAPVAEMPNVHVLRAIAVHYLGPKVTGE